MFIKKNILNNILYYTTYKKESQNNKYKTGSDSKLKITD